MPVRPLLIGFGFGLLAQAAVVALGASLVDVFAEPPEIGLDGRSSISVFRGFGAERVVLSQSGSGIPIPQSTAPSTDQVVPAWARSERVAGNELEMRVLDSRGWPFLAARCRVAGFDVSLSTGARTDLGSSGAMPLPIPPWPGPGPAEYRARVIPFIPLWPGLVADAVVFAIPYWIFSLAIVPIRRHMRTSRGLCVCCGYPARPHGACSECGHTADVAT